MRFLVLVVLLAIAMVGKAGNCNMVGDLPDAHINTIITTLVHNFSRGIDNISAAYCDLLNNRLYWNVATGIANPIAVNNAINDYSALVSAYSCAGVQHYRRNGTLQAIVEQEDLAQNFPPLTAVGAGTAPGSLAYDNVVDGMVLPRLCLQKGSVGHITVTQPGGWLTEQFVATFDIVSTFRVVNPLVVPQPAACLTAAVFGTACYPTTANYLNMGTYIWAIGTGARTLYFQRIFVNGNAQFCIQQIHDGDRFDINALTPSPQVVGGPLFT